MQSALEKEILDFLATLKQRLKQRDRGVVMGLLLAIVPIPPAPMIGLLIAIMNMLLLKHGRIPEENSGWIKASLVFSVINITILILFAILLIGGMSSGDHGLAHNLHQFIIWISNIFRGVVTSRSGWMVV